MTFAFNTLNELLTYLQAEIAPNGNQEITGQRHQDVVVTIAQSLVNIVASIPPTTVNQFPPYDADHVYAGGVEVIVRSANKLWLFVSADDQVGVTPGTNGLVWQEISAAQLAHFRNQDTHLGQGTPSQVSAVELRALLDRETDGGDYWLPPVDEVSFAPIGDEPVGYRYLVLPGADEAFLDKDGQIATRTSAGWDFYAPQTGDAVRQRNVPGIWVRTDTEWHWMGLGGDSFVPSIQSVLGASDPPGVWMMETPIRWLTTLVQVVAPGTVTINSSTRAMLVVEVGADVVMARTPGLGSEYAVVLVNTTGTDRSITWGAGFGNLDSVELPTVLSPGPFVLIRFTNVQAYLIATSAGPLELIT